MKKRRGREETKSRMAKRRKQKVPTTQRDPLPNDNNDNLFIKMILIEITNHKTISNLNELEDL
jgi:hypothetical protein